MRTEKPVPPGQLALALAILPALLIGLGSTPVIRLHDGIARTLLIAGSGFGLWALGLWARRRKQARRLRIEFVAVRAHYVQTLVQLAIYGYWGAHWHVVADNAPLIVAQLLVAYCLEMLVSLSRRSHWVMGFGPFPMILSANLFLLFRPDWFYLQFVLVAVATLGKEFVVWRRDGRRTHIFNPSALALFVVSIALIATDSTNLTWAEDISTTLNRPEYIHLEIFMLGLVVQWLFFVTAITFWAAAALIGLNILYTHFTGTFYFLDSSLPIAVFVGFHLLVTDPATSPKTGVGKAMFGAGYGVAVFAIYGILESLGLPRLYDKLLFVPVLNLMVPWFDRWSRHAFFDRVWFRGSPRAVNTTYMFLWTLTFVILMSTGFLGSTHPGRAIAFWRTSCDQGLRHGCRNLLTKLSAACGAGHASACHEAGRLSQANETMAAEPAAAGGLFARGCDLGFEPACTSFGDFVVQGGDEILGDSCQRDDAISCYAMGVISIVGIGRAPDRRRAIDYWDRACERGWPRACADMGMALMGRSMQREDVTRAERALRRACQHGFADSCATLGMMHSEGPESMRDSARAEYYRERGCRFGSKRACEGRALPQPATP